MSMYRQLWLAIILSTVLGFIGALLASTISSRTYVNEQLRLKNEDNAAVLALSLGQRNIDPVDLELVVTSIFDNGHFASIYVTDARGKKIVEKIAKEEKSLVPDWFMRMFPIVSTPGHAQIMSVWKPIGTISVVSQSIDAYQTLWKSTKDMFYALSISGLIAGYLAVLVLRRLKRPLQIVIDQARGMTERRFITTPVSKVPELKHLSLAMNSTVALLQSMFAEEAERLESMRKQANSDPLTGVANRAHFISQLQATVEEENAPPGSLIIVRLTGLSDANKTLGRNRTDTLLKNFGRTLLEHQEKLEDGLAARLNGTDFALLFRQDESETIAGMLLDQCLGEFADVAEHIAFYIGYCGYDFGISPGALLSQIDAAVASAEATGHSSICRAIPLNIEHAPRSAEEWSKLILRALEQQWVKLAYFPVSNHIGTVIHKESALRLMFGGEWFPAGRFLPIAERLALTDKLDLVAIKLALEELSRSENINDIAVNLSAQSIRNDDFRKQLRAMLMSKPAAAKRLWLEVPENGVFANLASFRSFHHDIAPSGCKLGLEHFGKQFDKINLLHDFKLDYVKIDSGFVRHLELNDGNQAFIKGVGVIMHRLGLQIYAEGVSSVPELKCLADLGIDGVTGPEVGRSFPLAERK
ncbi:MAG: EAL domain-containing protein [Undibacterium sp.]|nr:EAL domain-containing protein [Undibacterium sp.]